MTRPIKGWCVQATCPHCAGTLAHIADGRPSVTETRAVAECLTCRREWGVELHLFPLTDILPKPRPRPLELEDVA